MRTDPILHCSCVSGRAIPVASQRAVAEALAQHAGPVTTVEDLCGLAARRDPLLRELAGAGPVTVIACRRRVVQWLFAWAGAPLAMEQVRVVELRAETPETLRQKLAGLVAPPAADDRPPPRHVPAPDDGWRPWFPVLDYDRCSNCRQCLEFCLFGVYGTDEGGRVTVRHPERCKDNCPSCARLCPRVAILFPKIEEESPINGSLEDPVSTPDKVRLRREQLFGAATLEQLRARQRRPRLLRNDLDLEP